MSKKCITCGSDRMAAVCAKCSDLCFVQMINADSEHDGYVPEDMNIGDGDYVEFAYCLNCGQIQDEWPCPTSKLEREK